MESDSFKKRISSKLKELNLDADTGSMLIEELNFLSNILIDSYLGIKNTSQEGGEDADGSRLRKSLNEGAS